jgi:hypothetical protein
MQYDKFEDWFDELEAYGLRSERFWWYVCNKDQALHSKMRQWLEAAFEAGQTSKKAVGH